MAEKFGGLSHLRLLFHAVGMKSPRQWTVGNECQQKQQLTRRPVPHARPSWQFSFLELFANAANRATPHNNADVGNDKK